MRLVIKHQEKYSRGELLLRTFFGWLYIFIPHYFLLFFVSIWGAILQFVAFWVILFTGRYPQSMFEFQVGLLKWTVRLSARAYNVSDGYPSFGINGTDEFTDLNIPYPEKVDRGLVLLRFFLGVFYVLIPHYFILGVSPRHAQLGGRTGPLADQGDAVHSIHDRQVPGIHR